MAFYFEAMSGPYKGKRFLVKEGYKVGRSEGQVLLKKDPKVSSAHALVRRNKRGQLVLVDQKSANGIKVHGQKVRKVTLLNGMTFELGRTLFKVVYKEGDESPAEAPPEKPTEDAWIATLRTEVPEIISRREIPSSGLKPFEPAVELSFVQGIQTDKKVYLGFGPREFGSDTLDIELEETTAPPIAFEIVPTNVGIEFRTSYPKLVLFNEKSEESKMVKEGDSIRVGQTVIKIGFKK